MRHYGRFGIGKPHTQSNDPKMIHTCILYECLRNAHSECPHVFEGIHHKIVTCLCPCHVFFNSPTTNYVKGGR